MNILHLVQDEKFIDFFSRTMDLTDGNHHHYIVHTPDSGQPLLHIKQITPFRRVNNNYFSTPTMNVEFTNCDVLVVHFLTPQGVKMINAAPTSIKIVWSGWGGDYYYLLPGGQDNLLSPETREISKMLDSQRAGKNILLQVRLLLRPIRRLYYLHYKLIPAINKVNFFSSPIPEDYLLLKTNLGNNFNATYVQLNYGSVEETFAVCNKDAEKINILVGNSATLTNNHVEVFRLLANQDLTNRKVIVPLSYGDSDYREIVLDYGKKILGHHFHPITDFLPLLEFNRIISTCSCAIMNHYRQQALGTIGSLLYGGTKLFLNTKNVISQFLDARGAYFSDINELTLYKEGIFSELTTQQQVKNIEVLMGFWGKDVITKNAVNFIKKVGYESNHDK